MSKQTRKPWVSSEESETSRSIRYFMRSAEEFVLKRSGFRLDAAELPFALLNVTFADAETFGPSAIQNPFRPRLHFSCNATNGRHS